MRGRGLERWVLLAVVLVVIAVQYPRALPFTTDSESYLDVARNLLAGDGLVQRVVDFWRPAYPDPLGLWPPLYPTTIAVASRLGVPLELAGRLVPIVSFIGFAFALLALARRAAPRAAAWLATGATLLTPGIGRAAVTAWSEMPFLALTTAGFVLLADLAGSRGETADPRPGHGAVAGLLVGLAAVTRYVGWLLVPFGLAILLARRVPRSIVIAWVVAAAAPPFLWAVHNVLAFGHVMGPGLPPSRLGIAMVLANTLSTLRWGFLPDALVRSTLGVLAALAFVAVGLAVALRRRDAAGIAAWFTVLYFASLVVARTRVSVNDINDRYLTPAYPFLWLAAISGLATLAVRARVWERALALAGIVLGLVSLAGFVSAMKALPVPAPEDIVRRMEFSELRRIVPLGATPVLSDVGHRLRSATGRGAIVVPGERFQLRPFDADDEARWHAAGVRDVVFRRALDAAGEAVRRGERLGPFLSARIAGGPGSWTAVDSTDHFILYRIP